MPISTRLQEGVRDPRTAGRRGPGALRGPRDITPQPRRSWPSAPGSPRGRFTVTSPGRTRSTARSAVESGSDSRPSPLEPPASPEPVRARLAARRPAASSPRRREIRPRYACTTGRSNRPRLTNRRAGPASASAKSVTQLVATGKQEGTVRAGTAELWSSLWSAVIWSVSSARGGGRMDRGASPMCSSRLMQPGSLSLPDRRGDAMSPDARGSQAHRRSRKGGFDDCARAPVSLCACSAPSRSHPAA